MNTKKCLIMLSILASVLFSVNSTFTRGGWGWAGPAIVTGAVVGTSIAASNAAARDRDYARYRERQAERRHREKIAAINASQRQLRGQYPVDEDYVYEE